MARFDQAQHDEAVGHYRSAGFALLGLGGLCFAAGSALTFLVEGPLFFIDGPTMMLFSGIMLAVGAYMLTAAKGL